MFDIASGAFSQHSRTRADGQTPPAGYRNAEGFHPGYAFFLDKPVMGVTLARDDIIVLIELPGAGLDAIGLFLDPAAANPDPVAVVEDHLREFIRYAAVLTAGEDLHQPRLAFDGRYGDNAGAFPHSHVISAQQFKAKFFEDRVVFVGDKG